MTNPPAGSSETWATPEAEIEVTVTKHAISIEAQHLESLYNDARRFAFFMGYPTQHEPVRLQKLHFSNLKKINSLNRPNLEESTILYFRTAYLEASARTRKSYLNDPSGDWLYFDSMRTGSERLKSLTHFLHRMSLKENACLFLRLNLGLSYQTLGLVLQDSATSLKMTLRLGINKLLEAIFEQPHAVTPTKLKFLNHELERISQALVKKYKQSIPNHLASNWLPKLKQRVLLELVLGLSVFVLATLWHKEVEQTAKSTWAWLHAAWHRDSSSGRITQKLRRSTSIKALEEGGDADFSEGDLTDGEIATTSTGQSEVWRFHIKTDSPEEVRAEIMGIFKELNMKPTGPRAEGIEAPGGIQIDFLAAQSVVPDLKRKLEHLALTPGSGDIDLPFQEAFTWYKSRSKAVIPAGQIRVVIWLSQI